ncbi:hypothetical protein ACFWM7_19515 [Streptomyces sp. NPDC058375]
MTGRPGKQVAVVCAVGFTSRLGEMPNVRASGRRADDTSTGHRDP